VSHWFGSETVDGFKLERAFAGHALAFRAFVVVFGEGCFFKVDACDVCE